MLSFKRNTMDLKTFTLIGLITAYLSLSYYYEHFFFPLATLSLVQSELLISGLFTLWSTMTVYITYSNRRTLSSIGIATLPPLCLYYLIASSSFDLGRGQYLCFLFTMTWMVMFAIQLIKKEDRYRVLVRSSFAIFFLFLAYVIYAKYQIHRVLDTEVVVYIQQGITITASHLI